MVLNHAPISGSTDAAKTFAAVIRRETMLLAGSSAFEIRKATSDTIANQNAFQFQFEYQMNGIDLRVEQTLFIRGTTSFLVTCTSDNRKFVEPSDWCASSVASFVPQ
jgi:hypothetical protein